MAGILLLVKCMRLFPHIIKMKKEPSFTVVFPYLCVLQSVSCVEYTGNQFMAVSGYVGCPDDPKNYFGHRTQ